MSKSTDYEDSEGVTISEKTLETIIEQHDAGWNELPDDAAFANVVAAATPTPKRKRLAEMRKRITRKLGKILRRKRSYAYRFV